MKTLLKITACILCIVAFSHLFIPVSAEETGIVTLNVETAGTNVTVTVAMQATEITSLGVHVVYSDGLTLSNAEWVIDGLIVSFDTAKNKGVYSPGSAPASIGGNIFQFSLTIAQPITDAQAVSVTVIGKHGADTVFEETVSQLICEPAVIWGDADGNGLVDANDALLIKRYTVGAVTADALNLSVCDLDGNKVIDANDALLIQRFSVGAISSFPGVNTNP